MSTSFPLPHYVHLICPSFCRNNIVAAGKKGPELNLDTTRTMPTPQDEGDLQLFLGKVNFVSLHTPKCADKAAPLRDLLRRDVSFLWQDDHQASSLALKHSISPQPCLRF